LFNFDVTYFGFLGLLTTARFVVVFAYVCLFCVAVNYHALFCVVMSNYLVFGVVLVFVVLALPVALV